jgi:peptidoglycan/LPS O-acetylase OafA/YrhL
MEWPRTSSETAPKLADNPWLDLIRSIAIALVLLRHGQRAIAPSSGELPGWLHAMLMNGWVGVDLFLVLSGYLISTQLVRTGAGSKRLLYSHYLMLRALRILPAYFAVLALILASVFPFYTIDRDRMLSARILYHLLFMQDYPPSDINVVFWSLGVEVKFYVLAPIFIWALARDRLRSSPGLLIAALFMLSPVLRGVEFLSQGPAESYDEFFRRYRSPLHASLEPLVIGIALALAYHARAFRPAPMAGAGLLAASTVVLLAWLGSRELMVEIGAFDAMAQPTLIACLCGLMTLGAIRLAATPMPAAAPVRVLARLSYSLYLVHFPLMPLAVAAARSIGHATPVFWVCYLVTSFVCAGVLHGSVERPFLRLRSRLLQRQRRAGMVPDVARRGASIAARPVDAGLGEALLPVADRRSVDPGTARHFGDIEPFRGVRDNPGPRDLLWRPIAIGHDRGQAGAIRSRN